MGLWFGLFSAKLTPVRLNPTISCYVIQLPTLSRARLTVTIRLVRTNHLFASFSWRMAMWFSNPKCTIVFELSDGSFTDCFAHTGKHSELLNEAQIYHLCRVIRYDTFSPHAYPLGEAG